MTLADLTLSLEGDFLSRPAPRAGFVLLGALLLSFLCIRLSTRLMRSPKVTWWPGSVKLGGDDGLHVHHHVFGIVILLVSGFLAITLTPPSPWAEILAAGFGIGAGLTLDEFALWLHLEDVYWAEEGRRSLDAIFIALLLGGLVIAGATPFGGHHNADSIAAIAGTVAVVLALSAVAVLKGKFALGLFGLLFVPCALAGAIRLAKPDSPWARRRYAPGSRKLARAETRHADYVLRYRRWQNLIGGRPDAPST